MAKNIVIGVGNLLFCDDGIGVIVAKFLEKNYDYEPKIEILDGGTLGFNLIDYFTQYDNVFIVDTISMDDEVGEIYKIPSDELLGQGSYKKTAHEVEVVQMLEACELYEKKARVTVFGIIPYDIQSVEIGLSEVIRDKFDVLVKTIIKAIEELDVKVTKKADVGLETIIKELQC